MNSILTDSNHNPSTQDFIDATSAIELVETHISMVLIADKYVYKVKKAVQNSFLDYSTLERRKHFCEEELRLDRRYAPGLYLNVVAFTKDNGKLSLNGNGDVCEYAVKMHRFPSDALLSRRLAMNSVSSTDIEQLAEHIAAIHKDAACAPPESGFANENLVLNECLENTDEIIRLDNDDASLKDRIQKLREWTLNAFETTRPLLRIRKASGMIRECHGDMHCGNIVLWREQYVPFDGIEFNEEFRWIDPLSDIAFLLMDLKKRHRADLSNLMLNAYLQASGDYDACQLIAWYSVYRSLVRAKVESLVMSQHAQDTEEFLQARHQRTAYIDLASHLSKSSQPRLWITHGFSGSGKSTGAKRMVASQGAIQLRADVERKRMAGLKPLDRPDQDLARQLYSASVTVATYERLKQLARSLLSAGCSVVVDATFLIRNQRQMFYQLAQELRIPISILDFQEDEMILRARLEHRAHHQVDASDADISVLQQQLQKNEPLDEAERAFIVPG